MCFDKSSCSVERLHSAVNVGFGRWVAATSGVVAAVFPGSQ